MAYKNPFTLGTVLRTHPRRGFWGCAIVLSACDETAEMHAKSHIAITTYISKRKYAWKNVDQTKLQIVSDTPEVRVGPDDYRRAAQAQTCIGIYTLKKTTPLDVVGTIDPQQIYSEPLTFEVGPGTNGTFPLCGPITENLGWQAAVAFRKVHDSENFQRDSNKSRARFEKAELKRLKDARAKRKTRKNV